MRGTALGIAVIARGNGGVLKPGAGPRCRVVAQPARRTARDIVQTRRRRARPTATAGFTLLRSPGGSVGAIRIAGRLRSGRRRGRYARGGRGEPQGDGARQLIDRHRVQGAVVVASERVEIV